MALDPDELQVLETFRPQLRPDGSEMRLPHILVSSRDTVIAERLTAAGLLVRRRQARKGFPALYTITDAGVAQLPAEAPARKPQADLLAGHTSPPRG